MPSPKWRIWLRAAVGRWRRDALAHASPQVVRRTLRAVDALSAVGSRVFQSRRQASLEVVARVFGACLAPDELESLAREHRFYVRLREQYLWSPWPVDRVSTEVGPEARVAIDAGGGAVVCFFHHGPYLSALKAFKEQGLVAGLPVATAPVGAEVTREAKAHTKLVEAAADSFPAGLGSLDEVRRRLRAGGLVALPADLPGRTDVRIFGSAFLLDTSYARIARLAGVPLICCVISQRAGQVSAYLGPVLDPAAYGSISEVVGAVTARFEAAVLAWPAVLEMPPDRWLRAAHLP